MLCTLNIDEQTKTVVRRRALSVMFNMISHQTNRWISSSGDYILLSANVSPTCSSGLLQGNVFNHKTCSIPITRNNEWYDEQRQKTQSWPTRYKNSDSVSQKIHESVKWKNVGKWWSAITQQIRAKPVLKCIRIRLNSIKVYGKKRTSVK